ncbi:MAG: hypothetical protein ACYS9X_21670 [Planctomycetota bacterium]
MRRHLIFASTFLGGVIFVGIFLFGEIHQKGFRTAEMKVSNVLAVVGSFAIGMSLFSIVAVHGKRLIYTRKNWQYSLALFLGLAIAVIAGLGNHYFGESGKGFWWTFNQRLVFDAFIKNLGATMFSLLAFYIVSASYRAFRIRSTEAALMMASAFLVMLSLMAPVREHAEGVVDIQQWILITVNTGAQRAILIGSGLAGLVVGIRMWLGIERGTFFEQH